MSDNDRLGPPPIEPMTSAAWTRVERGLFEQLDAPQPRIVAPPTRARWPWIVVPAFAIAAAVAAIVITRGTAPDAPVIGGTEPAHDEPSRVVAGDTPSMVSFGDAHLTVDAHAAIVMTRENSSPSVLVERGAVDFSVAPREHAPYIVRAGDVVVRVVGTQFRVARYDERITVEVERGLVDVQFRGVVHRLSAGHRWSSIEQTAAQTLPSPVAAVPKPVPVAEPVGDEPPVAVTEPETKPERKPAVVDAERAKYEQLVALERRDPDKAIQGYLDLSKGNTKWSPVSLYAAGRLAFDRGDKRAHTFLTFYLKRFPHEENAKDARNLLSRLDGANP